MLDGREVGGGVIGSAAAFVIAEDHVHDPVHAFDRPVGADDRSELGCHHDQRCDVEACLPLGFLAGFTYAFDHDDALQTRPVMALARPVGVVDDRRRAGFDAAVIAVDRLGPADHRILEAFCSATNTSTSWRRVAWLSLSART